MNTTTNYEELMEELEDEDSGMDYDDATEAINKSFLVSVAATVAGLLAGVALAWWCSLQAPAVAKFAITIGPGMIVIPIIAAWRHTLRLERRRKRLLETEAAW